MIFTKHFVVPLRIQILRPALNCHIHELRGIQKSYFASVRLLFDIKNWILLIWRSFFIRIYYVYCYWKIPYLVFKFILLIASDWTLYPFATQNPNDFSNLMSVYLDAAFFPKLTETDFRWVFSRRGHTEKWYLNVL